MRPNIITFIGKWMNLCPEEFSKNVSMLFILASWYCFLIDIYVVIYGCYYYHCYHIAYNYLLLLCRYNNIGEPDDLHMSGYFTKAEQIDAVYVLRWTLYCIVFSFLFCIDLIIYVLRTIFI